MKVLRSILAVPLLPLSAPSLEIELDYQYDTAGFFDQAGSRQALRAVADLFERLIIDELAEIKLSDWPANNTWTDRRRNPATGNLLEIPGFDIPANTIIISVGARNLGGNTTGQAGPAGFSASGTSAFLDLIRSRGQTGAIGPQSQRSDTSLRTATIAFDLDRLWNFTTQNAAGAEFISTAIHEFCHVFGIGIADSWDNLIVNNTFTGTQATRSFGSSVPLQSGGGHWRNDGVCSGNQGFDPNNPLNILSTRLGVFGTTHGTDQIAIMDPSRCDNGSNFSVLTDLDIAGLIDVGWQIDPLFNLQFSTLKLTDPSLTWASNTFFDYTVTRSNDLLIFSPISPTMSGNGQIMNFTDNASPHNQVFYRLEVNRNLALPSPIVSQNLSTALNEVISEDSEEEKSISCGDHSH